MKAYRSRIALFLGLSSAQIFSLLSSLTVAVSAVCEWDYPIWMVRGKDADPLYRFVQDGKAGYIDQTGKIIIPPKFKAYGNYGGEFHNGLLEIGISDGKYVDTSGRLVIDKGFYRGWDFSEGLAVAMQKNGDKWGYIDHTGSFVISPRSDSFPLGYVDSFSDGFARIEVAKKHGYINREGEIVIQPKYLRGDGFHEGLARVVVEGPCSYFGDDPCAGFNIQPLGGGTLKVDTPLCKFTFIDKSGSFITTQRFDRAKDFSEGLAPVRIGEKWGFIDKKGKLTIEPKFDEAAPFSDGLARIRQGRLFGYVDKSGGFVIPPQYRYAEDFSEGLAVVSSSWNEEWFAFEAIHYINKQGGQAISETFDLASHFFKGLAHVKLRSDKNTINATGNSQNGTYAYINTSGKRVFTYLGER